MRNKYIFFLILIQLFLTVRIRAQVDCKIITNSYVNNVQALAKDHDNFIWLGTQDAVYRFDGKSFNSISNSKNNTGNSWQSVLQIKYFEKSDKLLVASINDGIAIYNKLDNSYRFQPLKLNLPNFINCSDIFMSQNAYWVCTNQGIKRFQLAKKNKVYSAINETQIDSLQCIASYHKDDMLSLIDNKNIFKQYKIADKNLKLTTKINFGKYLSPGEEFVKMIFNKDDVYLATMNGFWHLKFARNKITHEKKYLIGQNVLGITLDGAGFPLVSSRNMVYRLTNHNVTPILQQSSNFPAITSIVNYATTMILGLQSGLAITSPKNSFTKFNNLSNGKSLGHVYHISEKINNEIILSGEGNLHKYNIITNDIKNIDDKNSYLKAIPINKDGWIVSSTNQPFYLNSKNELIPLQKIFNEFETFKDFAIANVVKLSTDQYILSSFNEKGVLVWDKAGRKTYADTFFVFDGKQIMKSNNIFKHKQNIFLLGDSCIYQFKIENKTRSVKTISHDNKKYNVFMDMCKVGNFYALASYGNGIILCDSNLKVTKVINESNGLSNNGVYQVFNIGDTAILITSNNGLSNYNLNTNYIRKYFENDGLHNNLFEQYSGQQDGDIIYAGGNEGFTKIDLTKLGGNISIPIHPSFTNLELLYAGKPIITQNMEGNSEFEIPTDVIQATVHFQAIQYPLSSNLNYYYRINKIADSWIDLKNENYFSLIGLTPGKYSIEVKVVEQNHKEYHFPKILLHFLPKWYQTFLFKLLLVLTILALITLLYRFRIRQLKKVLIVRQKISQNLHDDIGSTLSAINLYTQVAKLNDGNSSAIENIDQNTKEVLEKLDDIIWATNPKNDKLKNLQERMEDFAIPLLNACSINFIFNHGDEIKEHKIGEAIRQNLFIIFKETINNVAKHSQCHNCTVSLTQKNKNIYYSITDDGMGFDATKPTQRNGLINMQLRVKELRGKILIDSSENNGTIISIVLPL